MVVEGQPLPLSFAYVSGVSHRRLLAHAETTAIPSTLPAKGRGCFIHRRRQKRGVVVVWGGTLSQEFD